MRTIIGIGETVLDIVFKNNQPQAAVPGGSVFNSMISLGRTVGVRFPGNKLEMVSQIGNDQVADIVTDFMKQNNVCTEGMTRIGGTQSTVSLAMLDENNDAHYEFFRDKSAPAFQADDIPFKKDDILLFGSFFAVSDASRGRTVELVRAAKEAGAIIVYDVNFRKNHAASLESTRAFMEQNIAMSSIVRASLEDMQCVWGISDAVDVYRDIISPLCPNFICTKGAGPAEVFSHGVHEVFDVQAIETVSTIGAGDNFNAGIIYSLVKENLKTEDIAALSPALWHKMVPNALAFSENVCQSVHNYVDEDFIKAL